jgi:hypothetical protein
MKTFYVVLVGEVFGEVVAKMEAGSTEEVFCRTQHGEEPWDEGEGVEVLTEDVEEIRSFSVGDLLVESKDRKTISIHKCIDNGWETHNVKVEDQELPMECLVGQFL